jgi:hypothetical protein
VLAAFLRLALLFAMSAELNGLGYKLGLLTPLAFMSVCLLIRTRRVLFVIT